MGGQPCVDLGARRSTEAVAVLDRAPHQRARGVAVARGRPVVGIGQQAERPLPFVGGRANGRSESVVDLVEQWIDLSSLTRGRASAALNDS
jgi:hypothetical protein